MAAETNTIMKADIQKAREIEFVYRFNDSIRKLMEVLGTTRMIPKKAGTFLQAYKATGTLDNTPVGEGELIPLSKYQVAPVSFRELTIKKWRKQTTLEAITKSGYDAAVNMTTDAMLKDAQKGIKADLFAALATGTGTASGATFQETLAKAWAQLQIKFEDTDIQSVYFMNQLDVADYLATANITLQNAFGMTYVENFLGLGLVIFNSAVPQGKIYATAADNIVLYYLDMHDSDIEAGFPGFTKDATGLIAISEKPDTDHMTVVDTVISGLALFAERLDGVVIGTIAGA